MARYATVLLAAIDGNDEQLALYMSMDFVYSSMSY